LIAAARGSRLSRAQVGIVGEYLRRATGGALSLRLLAVKTRGDMVRDRPISEIGSRGVFSGEVNRAVLRGEADIGVHSLKDLPSRLPGELEIVMVPPRGPPGDSLVPRRGLPAVPPEHLPRGALVAAGSARRRNMIASSAGPVRFTYIRGNLDTRLHRLDEGRADYLVAAEAGLRRLGLQRERYVLPVDRYVPSPGQGIIAVVAPRGGEAHRILSGLTHKPTHLEMIAERAFLEAAGGGCGQPIGGLARWGEGVLVFYAAYYDEDRAYVVRLEGRDPERLGSRAAEVLRRESPL